MNLSVSIHLNDTVTETANIRFGVEALFVGNLTAGVMIHATPEQFLQLADTIYAKHGEYQKEVEQKLGQEALNYELQGVSGL